MAYLDFTKFDGLTIDVRKCSEVGVAVLRLFDDNKLSMAEQKHVMSCIHDFFIMEMIRRHK